MKNRKFKNYLKLGILLFIISFSLENCENNNEENIHLDFENSENLNLKTVSFQDAKNFFNLKIKEVKKETKLYVRKTGKSPIELIPNWNSITHDELYGIEQAQLTLTDVEINRSGNYISKLFFINRNDRIESIIFTIYQEKVETDGKITTATIYFNELNGEFIDGYKIEDGKITKRLVPKKGTNIQKAGLFMLFQQKEDCWNTDTLGDFEGGVLDEVVIIAPGGGGGSSAPYFGSNHYTGGISAATSGSNSGNYSGGGGSYTSVTGLAGSLYTHANNERTLAEGEEEEIKNELTGKEKCAFEKLKELNLFKSTISRFGNGSHYNLILKSWTRDACNNSTEEGCTDASDLANGNITIYIQNAERGTLDVAATILHEGIHAEIYKYVDEHIKGIDPSNRANLLDYYFQYQAENNNSLATSTAQHQHMADKYVKPIAQALRQLDNNKYPLDDYMGLAWNGLRKYGWDGYWDNGKWVTLDRNAYDGTVNKVLNNTEFNNDCN